jgi:hypothetical protein
MCEGVGYEDDWEEDVSEGARRAYTPLAGDCFPTKKFQKSHILVSVVMMFWTVHVLMIYGNEFYSTAGPPRLLCPL